MSGSSRRAASAAALKILAHRQQAGIRHCFVEHDHAADPLASVRRSYQYLRQIEL